MHTVNNTSANVVRQADGTLAIRHYQVGDFAQGGVVFWVDETGEHGLVADIIDVSTGISWYNGVEKITNAQGNRVGAGEMNTMLIMAQQTSDNTSGTFAALVCANLKRDVYGDWYLPSREELNMMYLNKEAIDATAVANSGSAFEDTYYWSSTEFDADFAYFHNFGDGTQDPNFKNFGPSDGIRVRAIRAF